MDNATIGIMAATIYASLLGRAGYNDYDRQRTAIAEARKIAGALEAALDYDNMLRAAHADAMQGKSF